jgi:hypothetical protein
LIDISILRAMVAAGAPVEAILAAVEADQKAEGERVQARREKDAERQRCYRLSHPVTRSHSDSDVSLSSLLSSTESTTKKVESKKERARKSLLPATWRPNEAHYAKAAKLGIPADAMLMKVDDLRNWAASKAIMRADWDATFHGFLRPKANGASNGQHRETLDDRAGRLIDRAQELEFEAGVGREDDPFGGPASGALIDPRLPERRR